MISTCLELNIRTFVKIKFSGEYSLLGYDTEDEARAAFEAIETEYNDATGFKPPQLQEINRTNALLARVEGTKLGWHAIDLSLKLDEDDAIECIKITLVMLKRHGVHIPFNGDLKQFGVAYKSAKIREKSNEVRLKEAMQKQEQAASEDVKEYTIDDFYATVRAVQKLQGFTISEVDTNMRMFAGMVKELRELTRMQNSKTN